MFDKAEAEYRELSDKKRILHNDKDKIHKVRVCAAPQGLPLLLACTNSKRPPVLTPCGMRFPRSAKGAVRLWSA